MNKPVRHLAVAVLVLFALLLANINYVQVFDAEDLRDNPDNTRTLQDSYSRPRGQIVVGDQAIASSKATDDARKYRRVYRNGRLYAPATGYYTLYSATGIERAENSMLSGEDDRLFVRRIADLLQGREQRGASVTLTLRAKAQRAAYQALKGHTGAVVALDPKTGAILAMATSPSFDPNDLSGHNDRQVDREYKRLAGDDNQPLVNRGLSSRYPPGSTFKLVTAAAALESGDYEPSSMISSPTTYRLPGTESATMRNFGGEVCGNGRQQSLKDALTISCNTAFGKLAVDLGDDAMREQAAKFGFGHTFEVPMVCAKSEYPADPDRAQTALTGIGQFDVAATPLQMAMVSGAIANRGVTMQPYLVSEIKAPDLKQIQSADPQEYDRAVSPRVADQLTQMMKSVVDQGTGTQAQLPNIEVAGKTGTAQHAENKPPHAWFTGFAPADDPEVAVAVIVEDGGDLGSEATGGAVAAPIARDVMRAVINQ